jgi:hypothetical protein
MNKETIALVGSSTNLLNKNYARLIDSHDWVIRFNQARVTGFENHVGSKTSIRMINHHVFTGTTDTNLFSKYDVNFIPSVNEPLILCRYLSNFENIAKLRNIKVPISYIKDETYSKACVMLKNEKSPSMGFISIVFALEIFDNISIFGFDLNKTNNPSHYWEETNNFNASNYHNFSIENEKIKELIEDKKIKYYE